MLLGLRHSFRQRQLDRRDRGLQDQARLLFASDRVLLSGREWAGRRALVARLGTLQVLAVIVYSIAGRHELFRSSSVLLLLSLGCFLISTWGRLARHHRTWVTACGTELIPVVVVESLRDSGLIATSVVTAMVLISLFESVPLLWVLTFTGVVVHAALAAVNPQLPLVDGPPGGAALQFASTLMLMLIVAGVLTLSIRARARLTVEKEENSRRFEAITRQSYDLVVFVGPDLRVAYASPAATEFGWPDPAAMRGLAAEDVMHPDDVPKAHERFRHRFGGQRSGDAVMWRLATEVTAASAHTEGGEYRWVESVSTMQETQAGPVMIISIRDVSERVRVNSELEAAAQEAELARSLAEEAVAAKAQFMSRASHELRTPLNAIIVLSGLLAEEAEGDSAEDARRLLAAAQNLHGLLGDILDVSASEHPNFPVNLKPASVRDAVRSAVELVVGFGQPTSVSVTGSANPHLWVLADRARLQQVLLNLLTNAVKYNVEGGSVTVSAHAEGTHVIIEVADTGVGISPDLHDRAFDPFARLGAERGDIPGTGLGLPMVKNFTEAMGGTVTLDSAVGRGTTFRVRLPRVASPQPLPSPPA